MKWGPSAHMTNICNIHTCKVYMSCTPPEEHKLVFCPPHTHNGTSAHMHAHAYKINKMYLRFFPFFFFKIWGFGLQSLLKGAHLLRTTWGTGWVSYSSHRLARRTFCLMGRRLIPTPHKGPVLLWRAGAWHRGRTFFKRQLWLMKN